jgi:hypothetical protein
MYPRQVGPAAAASIWLLTINLLFVFVEKITIIVLSYA